MSNNENLVLNIKNLKVEYHSGGDVYNAVNNVDFDVFVGETIGLVGETGAGKTTLALSIMKLLPNMGRVSHLTADELVFSDIDMLNVKDGDLKSIRGKGVSMIFQDPMSSLNPVITVGNQIAEVIKLHITTNKQEVTEHVERLLEMVGIEKQRKNEYPHQFSGGMKQRVVIAMALACNPKLLIADEPTTALDVTIQAQVLEMMNNLKGEFQTSMIMITHDLGIVAETCDRVAVMYAGEIIEKGKVEDIFESDTHHPYTVGLMGSLPDLEKESERLSPIEGLMPNPTDLPSGCKFHPRCPHKMDICEKVLPVEYVRNGHSIRCHLMENVDGFTTD